MNQQTIVDLTAYRNREKPRDRKQLNKGRKGSVYSRSGKLWVDFRYLGERVREPSGLADTPENRGIVRKQLNLIISEIENGIFDFGNRFPQSTKKQYFAELEGKRVTKSSGDVTFGEYAKQWLEYMSPGMSATQRTDYISTLSVHLLPYFGDLTFSEFTPVLLKKFTAHLKGRRNRHGKPLSAKRIRNIMIPLRVIVRDALDEYGWNDLGDPFSRLKLPTPRKIRVQPFSFEEWDKMLGCLPAWYRPYFNFAVQTGLRPSEQVALKWNAIDAEYIHIELSRVRNIEKAELKTHESQRRITIRPSLRRILEEQRELTRHQNSPYVFVNMHGQPVNQVNLRGVWVLAMQKSGLLSRRMYETRHTFASWALALGETPEWVARTLGHVDTSMVYRTYGRYIPNLTKLDGSAFEERFSDAGNENGRAQNRHNFGHNGLFLASCRG